MCFCLLSLGGIQLYCLHEANKFYDFGTHYNTYFFITKHSQNDRDKIVDLFIF